MLGYNTPVYYNESWYPMFLFAFVACLFIMSTIIAIDAIKMGKMPRDGFMAAAGIGVMLSMHPVGLAILFSLVVTAAGAMPFKLALTLIFLAGSSVIGFWGSLLGPYQISRSR